MGKRGPKPTPTAKLSLVRGDTAASRANEPEPERGAPSKPLWLQERGGQYASDHWDRLVEMMGQTPGWLRRIDGDALACYCVLYADFATAQEPAERQKAYGPLNKACANLGLSPADRARIEVEPNKGKAGGASSFMTGTG